jgi:predicted thioesterase
MLRRIVQKADTASNYSIGLNELLSSPVCVDMAIHAAVEAVDKHLPEGYITVGRSVNIMHDHATFVGMTVNVKATLVEISGRTLTFQIELWDELGEVAHGSHERMVVKREEVLQKAKDRLKYLTQRTF